jgi:hypothetical protein
MSSARRIGASHRCMARPLCPFIGAENLGDRVLLISDIPNQQEGINDLVAAM